jgi:hypothetical protein
MKNLNLSDAKAAKLDAAEDSALDIVQAVLTGQSDVDDQAKAAIKVLGIVAKNRQTVTHRQVAGFAMASAIGTPAELKKYIAVTSPEVKRALTGKT